MPCLLFSQTKISDMTLDAILNGPEFFPIVEGGANKRMLLSTVMGSVSDTADQVRTELADTASQLRIEIQASVGATNWVQDSDASSNTFIYAVDTFGGGLNTVVIGSFNVINAGLNSLEVTDGNGYFENTVDIGGDLFTAGNTYIGSGGSAYLFESPTNVLNFTDLNGSYTLQQLANNLPSTLSANWNLNLSGYNVTWSGLGLVNIGGNDVTLNPTDDVILNPTDDVTVTCDDYGVTTTDIYDITIGTNGQFDAGTQFNFQAPDILLNTTDDITFNIDDSYDLNCNNYTLDANGSVQITVSGNYTLYDTGKITIQTPDSTMRLVADEVIELEANRINLEGTGTGVEIDGTLLCNTINAYAGGGSSIYIASVSQLTFQSPLNRHICDSSWFWGIIATDSYMHASDSIGLNSEYTPNWYSLNKYVGIDGTNIELGGNTLGSNSNDDNTGVGYYALNALSTGSQNTAIGSNSQRNANADYNTSIGYNSLRVSTGNENTAIGNGSLYSSTTGNKNTAIGNTSMGFTTTASENTVIGYSAGSEVDTGYQNVLIGYQAGADMDGDGNIFIGHSAGFGSDGSNRLMIDNNSSSTPLIYGDFSKDSLSVNGVFNSDTSYIDVINQNTEINGSLKLNLITEAWDSIQVDSAEIVDGDSIVMINDVNTVLTEVLIYYTYSTAAYTSGSTDSVLIKTQYNSANEKIGYLSDDLFESTASSYSSTSISTSKSDGNLYWLDLPSSKWSGGSGTFVIYYKYKKMP